MSCGVFDSLTFSEADRTRSQQYQAETSRRKAQQYFQGATLEEYLKYLEMEISVQSVNDFSIPRIAQLTQRTNQFNLMTRRYSEAEIQALSAEKKVDVRYVTLKDRFGDSGIVGVVILKYEGRESLIDSFLLSCRVLGRGVEECYLRIVSTERFSRDVTGLLVNILRRKRIGRSPVFILPMALTM